MLCKKCNKNPIYIKKRQLCENCYRKWHRGQDHIKNPSSRKKILHIKRIVKKYPGIIICLKNARYKQFYTLTQISEKYGVSREYIRQIYNLIYPSPQRTAKAIKAKLRGEDITSCANDPRGKVANIENKNSNVYIGAVAEKLFLKKCESFGLTVEIPCGTCIDLKINGYWIEVKSRQTSFRYGQGIAKYFGYKFSKKQINKSDFLACYHPTTDSFFIIPNIYKSIGRAKTFFISEQKLTTYNAKNNYWEYKDAYYLLAIPKDIKELHSTSEHPRPFDRPEMEVDVTGGCNTPL